MWSLRLWRNAYGFCQEGVLNYTSLRDRLLKFPYSKIDSRLLTKELVHDPADFLHRSIDRDSIAFACLKQYRQENLRKYHQYLLGSSPQGQEVTGRELYKQYYQLNIQQIKQTINTSTNAEEISFNLKKLGFLLQLTNKPLDLSSINLSNIQSKGSLTQKAYLLMIYSNQPKYLPFIETFVHEYEHSNKQEQLSAAFVVLSCLFINDAQAGLPMKLIGLSLGSIAGGLEQIEDFELFRVVENVFQVESEEVKQFTDTLLRHILDRLNEENLHPRMPLLLKTLKLRNKLKLDNSALRDYIRTYPMKFKKLFLRRNIDKEPLLRAICNKNYLIEDLEIRKYFTKYIVDFFKQTAKEAGCELTQLIDTTKLALKYFNNFVPKETDEIKTIISSQLIEIFEHELEVCLWLVNLLARIDKTMIKNPKVRAVAEQTISYLKQKYHKCTTNFDRQIAVQNALELSYHILRADESMHNPQQFATEVNFRSVRTFQPLIYACFFICKAGLSAKQNFAVFNQIRVSIEHKLKENSFRSEKHLYIVLQAIEKSKCEEMENQKSMPYLLGKIQDSLISLWSNKKSCPLRADLLFVQRILAPSSRDTSRSKYNPHYEFMGLLDKLIHDPQQFQAHLAEFSRGRRPSRK